MLLGSSSIAWRLFYRSGCYKYGLGCDFGRILDQGVVICFIKKCIILGLGQLVRRRYEVVRTLNKFSILMPKCLRVVVKWSESKKVCTVHKKRCKDKLGHKRPAGTGETYSWAWGWLTTSTGIALVLGCTLYFISKSQPSSFGSAPITK